MKKLWLDFETYYDNEYSLKKITPLEYILEPRFEALGCAFQTETGAKVWVDGPELPAFFAKVDWPSIMAISHNALFDMLILSLKYKIIPGMYGDTLSMARNWISHSTGSVSLAECRKFYGLSPKGQAIFKMVGVNFVAMTADPALYTEFKAYALEDVEGCRTIYNKMMDDGFPPSELSVIDLAVRMATLPKFTLDRNVLAEHLHEVQANKQALLDAVQMDTRDNLMRDAAFAAMLNTEGVMPVPMKKSKATGQDIFAFAKTDKPFTDLLDHPNPSVQALVAARLGHKSTLEETRTQRFLTISNITDRFPIPLRYSGAHTHRFSGDWRLNLQNLPNGSKLRKALRAPKGHKVVSVDASQIEARINAVLSGEWGLVEDFRNGIDIYSSFAEKIYHYPVTKYSKPTERMVGKIAVLSLGYGSSAPVFQNMCRTKGNIKLTDAEAQMIVTTYRNTYTKIYQNWQLAHRFIMALLAGGGGHMWGPVEVRKNVIFLPNGNRLRYRDLKQEVADGVVRWRYMRGLMPITIYGAKLVENVVQALAFVHIMEVALRVYELTNHLLWPAHQVHDELVFVVPEHLAEQVKQLVVAEMSKSPKWMPNLPLAAEGAIGLSYGDT